MRKDGENNGSNRNGSTSNAGRRLQRSFLVLGIAFALIFSSSVAIGPAAVGDAFAEKGGKDKSGSNDNGKDNNSDNKGGKSKDRSNDDNSHDSSGVNSTSSYQDEKSKKGKKDAGDSKASSDHKGKDKSLAVKHVMRYMNETAEEKHRKHLLSNLSSYDGPYLPDMKYLLEAEGIAKRIGGSKSNSTEDLAELSISLATWKSTKGSVKMDVMNGTISVGNHTAEIHSGHAVYQIHSDRIILIGYIVTGEGHDDDDDYQASSNGTTTSANQTSTSGNQTSTSHNQQYNYTKIGKKTGVTVVKLWIKMSDKDGMLPTKDSPGPVGVDILSPRSKVAGNWFLDMSGEVSLSSS